MWSRREDGPRAPPAGDADSPAAHLPRLRAAAAAAAEKGGNQVALSSRDASSLRPLRHSFPPSRNGNCGVHELTKLGEVGPGGGTWGPWCCARAHSSHSNWKEPVLPASAAWDHPQRPSSHTPQNLRTRAERAEGLREGPRPGSASRKGAGAPKQVRVPR